MLINLLSALEKSAVHCYMLWEGVCVQCTLLVRGDSDPGLSHDSEVSAHTFPKDDGEHSSAILDRYLIINITLSFRTYFNIVEFIVTGVVL